MDQYTHTSVLLQEAIDALAIRPDGVYVDATLGGGGHALAILKRLTTGTLYAFDQDAYAIAKAKERLSAYPNIEYVAANFADLETELKQRGIDAVDGVLYDLGVSSFQFDMPERGFSYQHDSPLDMRMNKDASFSAYDLVNTWTPERIAEALFRYGEEPFARPIAKAIAKARALKPIKTTFELVDLIKGVLPAKILAKKGHPAKQTFQAIRIAVNDELDVFASSLSQAAGMLKKGGRIVVITFHSLEDRIAKQFFRSQSTIDIPKGLPIIVTETPPLKLVNDHVILPTEAELAVNNRAKSAKLRAAEKN
ncbi:MAG TPA: 16S rRNA (cytosine(1402)-N(4))-methyltransferase [Acholeplasmatales bacterium]|nr:MAG: 16S rRNA (cytosine(1402)-N(4))-methyltransferase [Tenericutes bacterium GWF2_57_13]HAQ55832.1 16S rRNA (cytosine(1402)-N(4))-methyltransferase [Acholeplasmatales bacterium]